MLMLNEFRRIKQKNVNIKRIYQHETKEDQKNVNHIVCIF